MSSNTNTLFWVITGAVIVLSVFLLVNTSQNNMVSKINDKFSGIYKRQANAEVLKKHYNHEENYQDLEITDESLFTFNTITGTITGYIGEETNVVFPSEINGVKVRQIGDMDLWNNYLYSQDCERFVAMENPEPYIQNQIKRYESMGIYKDGQCQKRVLLDSIVIPNTVTTIGDYAFIYNRNLKSVNLPTSITRIGNQSFQANSIESIKLDHLTNLYFIGSYAFSDNNLEGEVIIPDSVTSMDYHAFSKNNISSAIVSSRLGLLPMFTFYDNPNMESVTFRSSTMKIRELIDGVDKTFNQDSDFIIYVPKGSKTWYQTFPAINLYNVVEAN